ncbi:MAG: iron-sulfur cluster carrier protein ApbC [Phycisphaeraceae bacterium]|nr:iron-sulfur cluster carrier protein ApbC [Phycisphaeraceae bacterium]
MSLERAQIENALKQVEDPHNGRDLVSAKSVRNIGIEGGTVSVEIVLGYPAKSWRDELAASVRAEVEKLEGVESVSVEVTWEIISHTVQKGVKPLDGVKNMIAVASGKGGVGKSTVAVNLALALSAEGARVGILDADIYGPSQPRMLGITGKPESADGKTMQPLTSYGLQAMSIGFLIDEETPMIWRGPMVTQALEQMLKDTSWSELDYLVIDLPPGTGDVPLTMSQLLPLTGAVVVCTPQKVAQDDARRAIAMFKQLNVPLLGIVENMSYFVCDHGDEHDIFGRGGAAKLAGSFGAPLLGTIPIHTALRKNSDAGNPTANYEDGGPLAEELTDMVQATAAEISKQAMSDEMVQPTISVT